MREMLMRNTAPFFLLPFILVLVISLLPAEEQAPASVHPAQLLPDGASFVVEVPSAPELGRQMLKTGFGRLAVDPVLKPLIDWARLVVFKMHPGAGNVEPAIYSTLKMMKGSVVAAFYPGDGTRGGGSLVLAFETKAPHAETAELVTNILKLLSLPDLSVPDAYGQSRTWSLSRYHRITVERGNVVLILNPEPLEKVWGTHLGRPSLADSAARAMAREKLRQNALLYSYVPSHGGKVLRPLMNRDIIEALELDQAVMLMTQTWVDAGLVHEEARLFYREKPMRLLGLISEPAPITGAEIAPYHSAAWAHLSLDWSKERAAMARLGVLLDGDLTDLNIDFDPEDFAIEPESP